jgi:hypothetical protein
MRSRRHPTSHAIDCSAFSRGGEDKAKVPPNGLLIMVAARRGGRWQFVSFSNTPTGGTEPEVVLDHLISQLAGPCVMRDRQD